MTIRSLTAVWHCAAARLRRSSASSRFEPATIIGKVVLFDSTAGSVSAAAVVT